MDNAMVMQKMEKVADRLLHLGGADYEADKATDPADTGRGQIARDFGIEEWDWPQGIGLFGLCRLQQYYGDNRYDAFMDKYFSDNLVRGLPSKNINTTAPYHALLEYAYRTGNKTYQDMCLARADWLMDDLPRTEDGGFQHVTSAVGDRNGVELHEGQLWTDTLFMAASYMNKCGQFFRRPDFSQEAIRQFLIHIKYLYDKQTRLFYHGWTFNGRNNFGGIFWCRGNSWFTYSLIDLVDNFPFYPLPDGIRTYLLDTWRAQVDALMSLQDPDGLWHTVLDDPDSYLEASGSAAIAAGILKGCTLGVLDGGYRSAAERAVESLCRNISDDGTLMRVSAGTGIGMDAEHYKNILIHPMAYGQALALLALTQAL